MALSWDEFRLVMAIGERGGLTPAAVHLAINPSTAFRRLGAIEALLDARLFERRRTGYVATAAGEAMIAAARRMEADVAGFDRALAGRAQTLTGVLRVTAASAFVTDLLMPMLGRFRLRYPDLCLDVVVSEEALNLSRRDADVALRASNDPPQNLVGRRLSGIAWAVYGRAGVEPGAMADATWVGPGAGVAGGQFARFVRSRAAAGRIALTIDTVLGLREAIEAGIGIGPLPCYAGDADPRLTRLGPVEPELGASLWLLTHPDLRQAARVRAFLDFAAEALTPLRPALEGFRT